MSSDQLSAEEPPSIENFMGTDIHDSVTVHRELTRNNAEVLARTFTDNIAELTEDHSQVYSEEEEEREKAASIIESKTSDLVPLERTRTTLFSPHLKSERKKIVLRFLWINFVIALFCFTVLPIFWGSLYDSTRYFHKVNYLAVIQDEPVNVRGVTVPAMGSFIPQIIAELPGTWHIYNTTTFQDKFGVNSAGEIDQKVIDEIFDEHYWLAINVKANATQTLVESFLVPPPLGQVFNSSNFFEVVYESAKDITSVPSSILAPVQALETYFKQIYNSRYLPGLFSQLPSNLSDYNPEALSYATSMSFHYFDYRPFTPRTLYGPLLGGCIYALTITIFQFLIFTPLHIKMAGLLSPKHIILYRLAIAWCCFFFLSLFYCTVSAIFQISFRGTFGRGKFMVYWMTTWLYMLAVGGANENVASIIFTFCPPYFGFWVVFFVIINMSTSFFSMALNNYFFRFGYMLPMHNALDLYRVILADLSRSHMGRNYGILVAWVVLNTALFPFIMKFVGATIRKRAAASKTSGATH
ncbi:SNG1 family protein NDAI_0D02230 [Naumovozyma dairenensis CBS 421]|uniref:DUF3533 domain-containing protein n=1 Tax=Naumovozyma dairenensis (strain ATCC 10597 / BCRC 20456 / CBS 421 / NBRC 0211 / NRRL Y-12639) TaxID=1071378 RepID=G0W9S6_NAUDC|nr:hypothetical protein NDAI_0D02230 [Naumovozyma dairenensis CBS 421]CCD24537.1 hypothetical protein NDAI_0D02230 [Naumovozyma dairenensis CBS 421]